MSKRTIPEFTGDIAKQLKVIGNKVDKHRKLLNPNYRNFAEEHGINVMTLWRISKGEDYKMSSFLQLLRALELTPEQFFCNKEPNN
jgi:predicted transcriptional regulator